MKLLVEVDGKRCSLDLRPNGAQSDYTLEGGEEASGSASIAAITPGLYSVLLGERSFTVSVARTGENLEVWVAGRRYSMAVSDSRDRSVAAPATPPARLRSVPKCRARLSSCWWKLTRRWMRDKACSS